jgi:hypothetical protein
MAKPMTVSGDGREKTIVQGGGFRIKGEKDQHCTFFDLTIQKTKEHGLSGNEGMSFDCRRVKFDKCGWIGVKVQNTKGRLTNCQVTNCKMSGVLSRVNSTIEIEGEESRINNNCTEEGGDDYGLKAHFSSSIIHLLSPLTKEDVSTNNKDDRNYGGKGTIETVDMLMKEKTAKAAQAAQAAKEESERAKEEAAKAKQKAKEKAAKEEEERVKEKGGKFVFGTNDEIVWKNGFFFQNKFIIDKTGKFKGTFTWADGGKYVGDWENGKRHGRGTYEDDKGNRYVGGWKNDQKDGDDAVETCAQARPLYYQDVEDYIHCKDWTGMYFGAFKNDQKEGQGTYTWTIHETRYERNLVCGSTEELPRDKYVVKKIGVDKYVGQWKNGKQDGQGTMTFADSEKKYVGEWKNGLYHGHGTFTDLWGESKTCEWEGQSPYKHFTN